MGILEWMEMGWLGSAWYVYAMRWMEWNDVIGWDGR